MLMPAKTKYRKQQKGKMRGRASRGNTLNFGDFGLQAIECGWLGSREVEAARIAMTRFIKRSGRIWIRIYRDKPITKKPAETRMGKGKGPPEDWVAVLKPITNKAFIATHPDTAIDMFLRAYQTAISGRPGPVVMQIPFDIQNTLIEDDLPDPLPYTRASARGPTPEGLDQAVELMARAQRPLIAVGSGIHNARAWDELLASEAPDTTIA